MTDPTAQPEACDEHPTAPASPRASRGFSRRGLVAAAGGGAAGVLVGAGGAQALSSSAATSDESGDRIDLARSHPFYTGSHQAGIRTEPQRYCVFMTFDLTTSTARDLEVLLARWSGAIAQLMAGKTIGQVQPTRAGAVGIDTGEALDLGPSSLTVTLGLGPGVFDDRFGLHDKRPRLLKPLPHLPSDNLSPQLSGGDLSLQACADDPQVAYHAIRDLARLARGYAHTRWTVLGFGRASAGQGQKTPRNLLGFKDGTRNVKEPADFRDHVWADDDVDWMRHGTYQVARKISLNIEIWDADDVADQQRIFGRFKEHGAPLTGHDEFDAPDFAANGAHAIDPTSHIALAAPENNGGIKILRRGYNFTDGINDNGQLDAGLLFLAYMNDPDHFVRLQAKLGASDLLNEYLSHVGSGVFAIPPAPQVGHFIGEQLFR